MTTATEGVCYRKLPTENLPTENCIFRKVLLGTIIACSIICRLCKELYVHNKFEDIAPQMSSITWGNEATIQLWHTFYNIVSCYLNWSKANSSQQMQDLHFWLRSIRSSIKSFPNKIDLVLVRTILDIGPGTLFTVVQKQKPFRSLKLQWRLNDNFFQWAIVRCTISL